MKKRTLRRKFLYGLVGLVIVGSIGSAVGLVYLKQRFFRDHPNALTFTSELHPVPFQWVQQKYGSYTEPRNAILIPVSIPGLENKLYMQFDTGSPFSYLRTGSLESLKEKGIDCELVEVDGQTLLKHFELGIGNNLVQINAGRILKRDQGIDWDHPEAINIIGTLGSDFVDQKICEIDFPAKEIRLHDSRPAQFASLGEFTPFDFRGRRILLPAVVDGDKLQLLYDSGCSSFGLLTSKYHYQRYTDEDQPEINLDANRRGEAIPVHHKPSDLIMRLGTIELPLTRVSYVEKYEVLQQTVGRFANLGGLSGFLGNHCLADHTLILDTKASEFIVVLGRQAATDPH